MKTTLPASIATVQEAKNLLKALRQNQESFHPEDDTHSIDWTMKKPPTKNECDLLNKLMTDIYNLPGNDGRHCGEMIFDPCLYLLLLERKFFWKDKSGRGFSNTLDGAHFLDHFDTTEDDWNGKNLLEFIESAEEGDVWETRSQTITRIE